MYGIHFDLPIWKLCIFNYFVVYMNLSKERNSR